MEEEKTIEKPFSKVLIGRHNPENKCLVEEGELLVPALIDGKGIPKDNQQHFFNGVKSGKTSIYGWVKEVTPFSLQELIRKFHLEANSSSEEKEKLLSQLLDSIQKYPEGTPVAATFSERGFLPKKVVLIFHKVFFYEED